jgi:hypothetical protein
MTATIRVSGDNKIAATYARVASVVPLQLLQSWATDISVLE